MSLLFAVYTVWYVFAGLGFSVLLSAVVAALLSSAVFGYVVEVIVITPDYCFFLYVSHCCVFPKRSIPSWMYFIASCLLQVMQMIGSGCRFTDEKNLRTFILLADLEM